MNDQSSLPFVQGKVSSVPLESVVCYLDENGEHSHDYHTQFNSIEYRGMPKTKQLPV